MASTVKGSRFPVQQMAILAFCRLGEPVAVTSVNPYIPEMVASFGVPTDQIGVYGGWLSAVFSVCQAITGVIWGRAADKLGRKPMMLLALASIMVSSVLFGFSTSLAMAFITRSVQGASSGNVGIIRTAVAEMVPQKELQPVAFSIMPLVWNIGSIFGPSIGGFLSNPQRRGWFTGSEFFRKYPFALPNLVISVLFLICITAGVLFLKETHLELKHRRDYGLVLGVFLTSSCSKRKRRYWKRNEDEADPFLSEDGHPMTSLMQAKRPKLPPRQTRQPQWRDVFSKQSSINLIAYTGLAMHSIAFDQLLPVFMHHPTQSRDSRDVHLPLRFAGGFGLDSGRIGILFTIYGCFGMLVQLFLFPLFARKFGVLNCFKVCVMTFPCVYLTIPFTSLLSTSGLRQGICLSLMLIKCAAGIFAFPCSTILLTNSATSLSILGTLNGVSTSISAAGRAAGPALVGWAFTYGVDIGYIVTPFWTLFTIAIIAAVPVWSLVEMDGPYAKTNDGESDSDDMESDREEQQRLQRASDEVEVVTKSSGFDILSGTEEIDLLVDDIPVVTQSSERPSTVQRRGSAYSLHTLSSRTGVDPDEVRLGLIRRVSNDPDTTRSESSLQRQQ